MSFSSIFGFIHKGLKFVKKYFLYDPLFVFYCGISYFRKYYNVGAKFFSKDQVAELVKSGRSYIRLGDGELGMMHGQSIHYQKYEKTLAKSFEQIIKNYNQTSDYILAIPIFAAYSNYELRKTKGKLSCWLPLKVEFARMFSKDLIYADAHLFYYKNWLQENLEEYFKTKKLIIHTEKRNIDNQRKNIEKNLEVLGWVESLANNSFDNYEKDKKAIKQIIDKYVKGGGVKNDLIYIGAAGPLSKLLCLELSEYVQAIDMGKGFEHIYNTENFEHHI